jgi:hypothetical protein
VGAGAGQLACVDDLSGKPIEARISVQIKDPLGSLHPVLYDSTKKKLIDWPIKGRFRDFVIWPRSSAIPGLTLVLRVIVKAAGGKLILTYADHPHT